MCPVAGPLQGPPTPLLAISRVSASQQFSHHPTKKPPAIPGAKWAKNTVVTGRRRGDSNPQG